MGKKYGNDYRVWVLGADGLTWSEVKGQTESEIDESSSPIDTTTKDNFPYGTSGPGPRSITLTLGLIPDLPDANGYTRLESLAKALTATTVKLQIRKAGSAGAAADAVHECEWHVTARPRSFPMNGTTGARFTFANAAAPTIDTLA